LLISNKRLTSLKVEPLTVNPEGIMFSKIDTEEKAYWLGFLAADGCITVHKNGCKYIKIALAKKDIKPSKLSAVSSIFLFRKDTRTAKKIIKYLYEGSTIYLDRKYEKALLGMAWKSKHKEKEVNRQF